MCSSGKLLLLVFILRKLSLLVPWEEKRNQPSRSITMQNQGKRNHPPFSGGRQPWQTQGSPLPRPASRTENTFLRHQKVYFLEILYFFLCSLMCDLGRMLLQHLFQEEAVYLSFPGHRLWQCVEGMQKSQCKG